MWGRTRTVWMTGWIGVVLCAATGCTISIQPIQWHKGGNAPPAGVTDPATGGFVPYGYQGPMPKPNSPGPGPLTPLSFQGPNNEAMAQLIKQYNDANDRSQALQDQVTTLKKQLKDREDSLRLASHEIEESSTKIKKTRDEFRQWESEMTEMRDRVRKLEDNRRAVGVMIEQILEHLDRQREPVRLPSMEKSFKRD